MPDERCPDTRGWARALRPLLVMTLTYLHLVNTGCLGCTAAEINACVKPLQKYDFTDRVAGVFPLYSDDALDVICRFYIEMETCLRAVRPGCNIAERAQFEGIESAARFLCEDGKEEYRQHRDCYVTPKVFNITKACNQSYVHNLHLTRVEEATLDQKKRKICSHMETQLQCVKDGVAPECGHKAATWLHSMGTRIISPTMQKMNCFQKTKLGIPAIFGIMLAIFTIVMSVILTIVVCQKRRGHSSLRAIKPRSRGKQAPKKSACAASQGRVAEPLVGGKTNESVNSPLSKMDGCMTDTEASCTGVSTVAATTTVSDFDECTTTYIATDT